MDKEIVALAFESDARGVLVPILRDFIRNLRRVRPCTLELTHTIQLPALAYEINDELPTGWLRDCLQRLPSLQSLVVNAVRVFDYGSIKAIQSSQTHTRQHYALRLLDASACVNAIPTALMEAIWALPNLVYLGLSETRGAKDHRVLAQLKTLQNLRILKLARLHLQDAEIEIIAASIGHRVQSLDVRDNDLTDVSARVLTGKCFGDMPEIAEQGRDGGHNAFFEIDDLEGHVRRKLTRSMVGTLSVEDRAGEGLTHLYMARNRLTINGVAALLGKGRLHLLDVGEMPFYSSPDSYGRPDGDEARFLWALGRATVLRYLRITQDVLAGNLGSARGSSQLNPLTDVGPTNPERTTTVNTKSSKAVEATRPCSHSPEKHAKSHLHPLLLPKLRTLVLTDIPSHTTNPRVAQHLAEFIKTGCEQSAHAAQQAEKSYALPPGHSRAAAEREHTLTLFPLETINLEIKQIPVASGSTAMSRNQKPSPSWWEHPTLSTTNDRDSDAFWEAARNDFSFFEDDRDADGGRDEQSDSYRSRGIDTRQPVVDVVSEIARSVAGTARSQHLDICYIAK
ncbi:uncharacterized protein EI97DRAFT_443554 [Westerdykella ornata]|uniref:RNI-like protein n=1 Tax=Westerdykella ornata TaxID=318751 RepID=A0A6A6JEE1_WESOR|nr:uncharacterized protein EI97DRAFT_443554 [Westerdykella ornata]KAF2274980.1 hypothetical protein EI97DRAFT_443554 [Westerdykella ornata]